VLCGQKKYLGFEAISRLDFIEKYISEVLKIKIDAVQISSLNEISKKYILPEVINLSA